MVPNRTIASTEAISPGCRRARFRSRARQRSRHPPPPVVRPECPHRRTRRAGHAASTVFVVHTTPPTTEAIRAGRRGADAYPWKPDSVVGRPSRSVPIMTAVDTCPPFRRFREHPLTASRMPVLPPKRWFKTRSTTSAHHRHTSSKDHMTPPASNRPTPPIPLRFRDRSRPAATPTFAVGTVRPLRVRVRPNTTEKPPGFF